MVAETERFCQTIDLIAAGHCECHQDLNFVRSRFVEHSFSLRELELHSRYVTPNTYIPEQLFHDAKMGSISKFVFCDH